MKFIDEATIQIKAGDGGRGMASFRREKYVPEGGPDGGDGGRGGSIIAIADRNINTLIDYRYARIHKAKNGEPGRGADQYGRGADDIILRMPVGTVISILETGEVVADLARDGQEIVLAKGGQGGLGNIHFKSSTNRAPRQYTLGEEGEEKELKLELKVLADVGLLGMPNAGKSTFIRSVSNARPKVADYPFTTLHPNLGVVRATDTIDFVIADVPGLIEGAADGAGLGIQFLKHLQRTRLLLHLVDMAPFDENVDPVKEARAIVAELKKYDAELYAKPRWLVLNKLDLIDDEAERKKRIADIVRRLRFKGPVYSISAMKGDGTRELVREVGEYLETVKLAEEGDANDAGAANEPGAKKAQAKQPLTNAERVKAHLDKESRKS